MLTVTVILVLIAIVLTAVSAGGKIPLWPAVFVLCVIELLRAIPR